MEHHCSALPLPPHSNHHEWVALNSKPCQNAPYRVNILCNHSNQHSIRASAGMLLPSQDPFAAHLRISPPPPPAPIEESTRCFLQLQHSSDPTSSGSPTFPPPPPRKRGAVYSLLRPPSVGKAYSRQPAANWQEEMPQGNRTGEPPGQTEDQLPPMIHPPAGNMDGAHHFSNSPATASPLVTPTTTSPHLVTARNQNSQLQARSARADKPLPKLSLSQAKQYIFLLL